MSVARQRMAMISEAGVMSKPDSVTMPLPAGPRPVTIWRRLRSFTSSTRFHNTCFNGATVARF